MAPSEVIPNTEFLVAVVTRWLPEPKHDKARLGPGSLIY